MNYLEKLKNKKQTPDELPKGENVPNRRTAKTAKSPFDSKDSTGGRHFSENEKILIHPPEPANLGPVYDRLWMEAWTLADWIDGDSAPYTDRVAKLPELDRMRAELSRMEQAGAKPPQTTNRKD